MIKLAATRALLAAALCALAFPPLAASAQDEPSAYPSPNEIVTRAPASEWVRIAPEDLLVMDLAPDRDNQPRRVVIQLMPPPFDQGWIGNIRKLAAAHWWDGTSVNRVQDNYVVQWGDATEQKPLPEGLATVPESDYIVSAEILSQAHGLSAADRARIDDITDKARRSGGSKVEQLAEALTALGPIPSAASKEADRIAMISIASTSTVDAPQGWHERDSYASWVEFWNGWPLANSDADGSKFWPVHCYGMVGVGRDLSPDTGTGAELYTVIGQAPRHLDRNIALVGRVIEGMEHLSSLPRGTGDLGFYEDPAQRVPIVSVRLASEMPEAAPASSSEALGQLKRPRLEYLSTEGPTFAAYADARANRRDPFFNVPAGGADICNIPVPVRRVAP
ncbi:peptidylprolyl isomerase [Novosphingopyxis sp.]|uniref:peptidylprolyl isomerase n=1 Tax=Novosphingopyxis sp. TaxID=2709690 RepID=UPI003B58FCB9